MSERVRVVLRRPRAAERSHEFSTTTVRSAAWNQVARLLKWRGLPPVRLSDGSLVAGVKGAFGFAPDAGCRRLAKGGAGPAGVG